MVEWWQMRAGRGYLSFGLAALRLDGKRKGAGRRYEEYGRRAAIVINMVMVYEPMISVAMNDRIW